MPGAGFRIVVTELELFVGELAIDIKDFLVASYLIGHLDGENGFSKVAVCKEAAYFAFVPKAVIEVAGVGAGGGIENSLVSGLNAEHADKSGAGDKLNFPVDSFYRVEVLMSRGLGAVAIFHT